MRIESDPLLNLQVSHVFDRKPSAVSALPYKYQEYTPKHPRTGHIYAVEVCWPRFGRITCRTYLVCAPSDEEAAAKGRAEARRHVPSITRLEVVDLARLEVTETLFGREGSQ